MHTRLACELAPRKVGDPLYALEDSLQLKGAERSASLGASRTRMNPERQETASRSKHIYNTNTKYI